MAPTNTKRTRSERVASLQLEPSKLSGFLRELFTGAVLLRLGLALIAAVAILYILSGWRPAFSYREGDIPPRAIVARVPFQTVDVVKTAVLRDQKRREVLCFYENRPQLLSQLRSAVKDHVFSLRGEKKYEELPEDQQKSLLEFIPISGGEPEFSPQDALARLRALLNESGQLEKFDQALRNVLEPIAETGTLVSLSHEMDQGSQRSILVFPSGQPNDAVVVDVPRARLAEITVELPVKVKDIFQHAFATPDSEALAKMVSTYLLPKLATMATLTYRQDLSEEARRKAEDSVEDAIISYFPTVSTLAAAGTPITAGRELPLLPRNTMRGLRRLLWARRLPTGWHSVA